MIYFFLWLPYEGKHERVQSRQACVVFRFEFSFVDLRLKKNICIFQLVCCINIDKY